MSYYQTRYIDKINVGDSCRVKSTKETGKVWRVNKENRTVEVEFKAAWSAPASYRVLYSWDAIEFETQSYVSCTTPGFHFNPEWVNLLRPQPTTTPVTDTILKDGGLITVKYRPERRYMNIYVQNGLGCHIRRCAEYSLDEIIFRQGIHNPDGVILDNIQRACKMLQHDSGN